MSNTRLHLWSTGMAKVLRLCMHSHEKKIEMCNACVYQRSTGMAGVGFWSDLTSEGQFNSLYRLENVCFWTFVRQSLFICATLFFRLPFPSFGFWGERRGVGWEASGRVEKTTFQCYSMTTDSFVTYYRGILKIHICFTATEGSPIGTHSVGVKQCKRERRFRFLGHIPHILVDDGALFAFSLFRSKKNNQRSLRPRSNTSHSTFQPITIFLNAFYSR